MPKRCVGQLDFMDAAVSGRPKSRVAALAEISRLVDWAAFERLLHAIPIAAEGEPSYPPLVMFKVLLLQRWYGLSDPAMEAALSDRLSFMAFAGLSLNDPTPDHATIWRFREKLGRLGLAASGRDDLPARSRWRHHEAGNADRCLARDERGAAAP